MFRTWIFALLLTVATAASNGLAITNPGDSQESQYSSLLAADFDGDSKNDVVLGEKTAIPEAYRRIVVRAASGKTLLDIRDESFYYLVTTAPGPYPILVVGSPSGNWLQMEAFMYSKDREKMQVVTWNNKRHVRARDIQIDPKTRTMSLLTEAGWLSYRYEQGRLKELRH